MHGNRRAGAIFGGHAVGQRREGGGGDESQAKQPGQVPYQLDRERDGRSCGFDPERAGFGCFRAGRCIGAAATPGRRGMRRATMPGTSEGCQLGIGTWAIIAARASMALACGKRASRPASIQGSVPSRARTEATLSGMPLASSPIEAKRKSSNLAFSREKRAGKAMCFSFLERNRTKIWIIILAVTRVREILSLTRAAFAAVRLQRAGIPSLFRHGRRRPTIHEFASHKSPIWALISNHPPSGAAFRRRC